MENKIYDIYLPHEADNTLLAQPDHKKQLRATATDSLLDFYSTIEKKPFSMTRWRWLALALMNMLLIGYFAVFDSPQPLETAIKSTLGVSDEQYSYLYSFLAIPNIILPLIAGYIVDLVGVRRSMLAFALLVFVGQVILACGAQALSFNWMIAGRVVYSLGADPLNIAQIVMVNRWFKGKELALALSLATFVAGGGKAFCSMIIPVIYQAYGNLVAPFAFGAILCLFSMICVIVMIIWDRANEKRQLAIDPNYLAHTDHAEKVNLKDIRKFKPIVWLLVLNFGLLDGIIFTLRSVLNDLYHNLYGYSNVEAGNYISVHYLIMAIASPIMGKIIDKVGKRASTMFYSSFLSVIALMFYVIVPSCDSCWTPILPLIIFGLCVGIDDSAVFACLPLVLQEKYLGTGYGLYYVVENLMLMILPPIGGVIKGSYSSEATGYYWMIIFLLGFAVLFVLETFALFVVDRRNGRVLEKVVNSEQHEEPAPETRDGRNGDDLENRNEAEYVQMAY